MVAITGSWKAKFAGQQILADQWGTGYNPIHARHGGQGRNTAPDGSSVLVDAYLVTDEFRSENDYGYTPEDDTSVLWGYGTETGTSDQPVLGEDADMTSGSTAIPSSKTPFPAWGPYPEGIPGGTSIRAEDHGAETAYVSKQQQYESAAGGWQNKMTSEVNDAVVSDPSQYEMQTSMTQRDKVRAGSQVASGRENEYDSPIASRIPAMKEPKYSDDPHRLYDMTPKAQDMIVRPWYMRTAGTGEASDMLVNAVDLNTPMNRRPPENAYAGDMVGTADDAGYGYMSEDTNSWGY